MSLQRVFKKSYIEELQTNINVSDYLQDSFPYDESRCAKLYGIQHPEGLQEKLDPTPDGDLQSAIAIYEAYKDISPLLAQQDDLWVYLTHVDLFEYVKKRWPIIVGDGDDLDKVKRFIVNHWFRNTERFIRTTFAGFWWDVHMTIDNDRVNKYELTQYLFSNTEFRTSSFGELGLIRHKEAMIGIIEFIAENEALFSNGFNAKARFIRHLFDIIGGYKNLTYLKRQFFKETLEKYKEALLPLHDTSESKVGSSLYNEIN